MWKKPTLKKGTSCVRKILKPQEQKKSMWKIKKLKTNQNSTPKKTNQNFFVIFVNFVAHNLTKTEKYVNIIVGATLRGRLPNKRRNTPHEQKNSKRHDSNSNAYGIINNYTY